MTFPAARPWLERHAFRRTPLLGATLVALAILTPGCGASETCPDTEEVAVAATETPFASGATVFSACATCPNLPGGGENEGPATACSLIFGNRLEQASVGCFYGPRGSRGVSGTDEAVTDVPNDFAYCEDNCPDRDDLFVCAFDADAEGVTSFRCIYDSTCE